MSIPQATKGRIVLVEHKLKKASSIQVPGQSQVGVKIGKVVSVGAHSYLQGEMAAVELGALFAFDDAEASLIVVGSDEYYVTKDFNLLARVEIEE